MFRSGASSLRFPLVALYCLTGTNHTGASSPQLLYQVENSIPARNLATVSRKRETNTRFGMKSASRWTGTGSTCVNDAAVMILR